MAILNCLSKSKGLPHWVVPASATWNSQNDAGLQPKESKRRLLAAAASSSRVLTMPPSKSVLPPLRNKDLNLASSSSGSEAPPLPVSGFDLYSSCRTYTWVDLGFRDFIKFLVAII